MKPLAIATCFVISTAAFALMFVAVFSDLLDTDNSGLLAGVFAIIGTVTGRVAAAAID
jgi:uncharacterized membrane protein